MVHPTSLIGPEVVLGPGTSVGAFCRLEGRLTIGENCWFATGVAMGGEPMDHRYQGEPTGVVIGARNRVFEYTTVHRAIGEHEETQVGDDNFIMAYVHIAHNCRIGNACTITNGVQLGGHVEIGDGANLGGLVGIHQHCRVGDLAMVGACSYVNRDIPPYFLARGNPCRVRGVNVVGIRRAGRERVVARLRQAFAIVYRSGLNLSTAQLRLEELAAATEPADGREELERLLRFLSSSRRGVEVRTGPEDTREAECD